MVRDAAQRMGHFHLLAEAPGGVARVRQLVLELAVRGRLVAQDPSDEPASVLLARIAAERAQLVKEKKIAKSDPLPPVREEEQPFALPLGWAWARLGSMARHIVDGTHFTPTYTSDGIDFVSAKDIIDGKLVFDRCRKIPPNEFEKLSTRCLPRRGDLLVTKSGSIGRVAIVETDHAFTLFESVALISLLLDLNRRFFASAVVLDATGEFGQRHTKGVGVKHLHLKDLRLIRVPVPPLAEQQRIVAKIDALMAWCDQMEQRIATRDARRTVARDATLTAISRATAPRDAWKRAEANWTTLVQSADDVPTLRRLVLELAVRGQLVAQDASDEPASVLLARIAAERAQLVKEKKIAKSDPLPPVREEEQPFALPAGWAWARLASLGTFVGGGTPSKSRPDFWDGTIPWVSPKDMKVLRLSRAEDTISQAALDESPVKWIEPGALLMVVRGMILAHSFPVALTMVGVTVNQDMKALALHEQALGEYMLLALRASRDRVLKQVEHSSHGTCRLDSDVVTSFVVAIPPLAEQRRIVAKVNALMALCDRLEASARTQREAHTAVAAMLGRAVAAS